MSTALRLVEQEPSLADAARMVRDGFRLIAEGFDRIADNFAGMGSAVPGAVSTEGKWITADEAAAIACFPMGTHADVLRARRRMFYWARGKSWASRPNSKVLLVEEAGFRRWLKTRRSDA